MTCNDLDFVATMLADPHGMRFYPKQYTRAEAEEWLGRMIERYRTDGHALWLVQLHGDGRPIGQVGLLRQTVDGVDEPEIGYLIHAPYWRQGYAVEAASAVRDHAFTKFQKSRVISLIRPVNIPSQRVALRLGMKPEKLTKFRDWDSLVFSLERTAWAVEP